MNFFAKFCADPSNPFTITASLYTLGACSRLLIIVLNFSTTSSSRPRRSRRSNPFGPKVACRHGTWNSEAPLFTRGRGGMVSRSALCLCSLQAVTPGQAWCATIDCKSPARRASAEGGLVKSVECYFDLEDVGLGSRPTASAVLRKNRRKESCITYAPNSNKTKIDNPSPKKYILL